MSHHHYVKNQRPGSSLPKHHPLPLESQISGIMTRGPISLDTCPGGTSQTPSPPNGTLETWEQPPHTSINPRTHL